ncbi:MAG: DNA topoisomerase 4 subunit A [Gemmataceae bacterium]|nr:DNA topoisomerase 4 subunit A [Gemmataceae bacterium]
MAENIQTVSIARETHERYLRYAMSVISSRALPDVRDGLKPVQRRILYTMYNDLRLHFDGRPAKCARIVGEVMGKYHPHGDSAIYDAMVRMSQDWVMRSPLVSGQGNFGSVDGDPAAAYRYTEAKLAALSDFLMREIRQETVDFRPTYNNDGREPVVLPAEFPNLLLNGASGIAVGMATNIPPHNLGEIIRSCVHLIEDPEATTAVLMDKGVKGPDFPLGAKIIADRATLRKIYEEGEGSIKVQAEWKLEKADAKIPQIIITSIPYGTEKEKIENDIGEIIESRKLPGLVGQTNETNEKDGFRIALDLKPGTDPEMVMAYLYKHVDLQMNYSFNMTCLIPGPTGTVRPERLGLKAILQYFLDFRLITVRRRFQHDLNVLRRRIHILEGFQTIFNALDRAIKLIRESQGKADAAEKLIRAFGLDAEQTDAILDSQLYKIAQLEIRKITDELAEKLREAERIEAILKSNKRLWGVVRDELNAIGEKYGDRRKTRMATDEDLLEFNEESYIVRENTNVVLTRDGWIKRVGRLASVEGTRVREGDEVIAVVPANTLDHVVFFADDGTAYTMRVNEVPASSGYGEPIAKFFKLTDQVKVIDAATTDRRFVDEKTKPAHKEDPPGPYLLVATSAGFTLRIPLAPFSEASSKSGRQYVRLRENESVVLVKLLGQYRWIEGKRTKIEEESIFLVSTEGRVIHFNIKEVNVLSGAGRGVIGIKLAEGDTCIGGALVSGRFDKLDVETSGGITREFGGGIPTIGRGGVGKQEVKRTQFVKIKPPPIDLADWEAIEEGNDKAKPERNGKKPGGLFE